MPSHLERKITTRVSEQDYLRVKNHFHHGQQALFFRHVFKSLVQLIEDNQATKIIDYLYNNHELTLPKTEDK